MDESTYKALLAQKMADWEAAKAAQEKAEQARLDLERREAAIKEKEAEQAKIEQAQKDAQAKIDAEIAASQREKEMEKARSDAAEKARVETEARIAREEKQKAEAEAEEQRQLEKNKKYKAFMLKHDCSDTNKDEWRVENTPDGGVALFKLVATTSI